MAAWQDTVRKDLDDLGELARRLERIAREVHAIALNIAVLEARLRYPVEAGRSDDRAGIDLDHLPE